MEHILKIEALTKQYNRHNVIDNVNMSVQAGAIYGLIGRNGTGKTTILKIIGGLAKPSSGKICLSDNTEQNGGQDALRIGVLIEQAGIYPDMSARQNLKLKSLAMGIKDKEHINELMDIAGLTNVGKKPVKKYSLGMKQRLGIALALIGFPNLVILDEPLNGLDPQGIVEFRKIIARLNSERKINFIISSHILGELSKIATDYVIIHNGVLIEQISKILYAVAVTIATKIFYGNQFAIGSFSSLILLLGVQYFLHLGFACVIVFICVLTKSSAFTMASGILISFNIMSIVYSLVNKLIPFISSNADIDISQFMVDYNISAYNLETLAHGSFRAIAVGFIFVIISAVCACIVIEKRDVL